MLRSMSEGLCDHRKSDLKDHKKTRKDIYTKAWKNLRMGLILASLRKKEATVSIVLLRVQQ